MKRLILLRHAKSSWDHAGLSDEERPLSARGKKDAPRMGRRLKKREARPQLIVSSPAKRAVKTARLVAAKLRYPKKRIRIRAQVYEANVWTLLRLIRKTPASVDSLLVVGHNPAVIGFANYVTTGSIENIPTCGVVCMECRIERWSQLKRGCGSLAFFDYPRKK